MSDLDVKILNASKRKCYIFSEETFKEKIVSYIEEAYLSSNVDIEFLFRSFHSSFVPNDYKITNKSVKSDYLCFQGMKIKFASGSIISLNGSEFRDLLRKIFSDSFYSIKFYGMIEENCYSYRRIKNLGIFFDTYEISTTKLLNDKNPKITEIVVEA